MEWVTSNGGPLICIEKDHAHFWKGIDGNSSFEQTDTTITDYDRACSIQNFSGVLKTNLYSALILGDMPLSTTIVHSVKHGLLIVRVFWEEPESDHQQIIDSAKDISFDKYEEKVELNITSNKMIIFDSAYDGIYGRDVAIEFSLLPRKYIIRTIPFKIEKKVFFLLQQFS